MLETEVLEVMSDLKNKRIFSFIFTSKDLKKIQRNVKKLHATFIALAESETFHLIYLSTLDRFITGLNESYAQVIVSDYKPKEIISGYDLTPVEKEQFDFLDPETLNSTYSFFRVSGQVYYLGNFMRLSSDKESQTRFWDGAEGTSYFSANLVKFTSCGDSIIFATSYTLS